MNKRVRIKNKVVIFYARTYRYLKLNDKKILIYLMLTLFPGLVITLCGYSSFSYQLSYWCQIFLSPFVSSTHMHISQVDFIPLCGPIYFLDLPTKIPTTLFSIYNIIGTLLGLFVIWLLRKKLHIFTAFMTIVAMLHLVSSIFFCIIPDHYPYKLSMYSEMYIKQMVGLVISFMLMSSMTTGVFNNIGISKYITYFVTILYSLLFGSVRYIVFLWILSYGSIIYMPVLFFTVGPFFDFLYFVCFYALFMKHVSKRLEDKNRRYLWKW